MKKLVHITFAVMMLLLTQQLYSQGIVRSQGFGIRMNYWNITGGTTRIDVNNQYGAADINLSGVGFGLMYFSRAYHNLFLEMSLGAITGGEANQHTFSERTFKVETLIPFLVGLRYDFLTTRVSGALHPYLSAGGGPYSTFIVEGTNNLDGTLGQETIESRMEYGWYAGGGVNFVLSSWFALNADLKYHSIDIPELKDYSGVGLGIGMTFMWGRKRAIYEIKQIKLVVDDIYPAYFQFYTNYPIALVTVKNLMGHPVEVNISGYVKGYSQRPKESGYHRLEGGETRDIPVTLYFGRRLFESEDNRSVILDMDVQVRASTTHREQLSEEIVIHSKNAWDGNMDMLWQFLTPEDDEIRKFARDIVLALEDPVPPGLESFVHAKSLFNGLSETDLTYLPDPNIPFYKDDRVQFAAETVDAGSGDCDDLVILYASLLESLGIRTALVEVQDPEKELAHLYLLFDTGLTPEEGHLIAANEKRYIVRETPTGQKRVWVPVETTLVEDGFETAWTTAALEYLQEGVVRNGLTEGWVKIIDNH